MPIRPDQGDRVDMTGPARIDVGRQLRILMTTGGDHKLSVETRPLRGFTLRRDL